MFKSDWGRQFAFGLGLIAVTLVWAAFYIGSEIGESRGESNKNTTEYERHAEEKIRSTCLSGQGVDVAECVSKVIKTTNEESRTESDLVAQTEMARWAFYMLIATVGVAVITGAGVYYVWQTLSVTRKIGEAQARAYIHAEIAGIELSQVENKDGSNVKFIVQMNLINSGATPAHSIVILYDIQEADRGIFPINLLNDGQRSTETLNFIPSGESNPMRLSRVWHSENTEALIVGKDRYVRLTYVIKFVDEFGSDRETSLTSGTFHKFEGHLAFFPDKLAYVEG